ncbi:trypsin-like serine peptidase [Pseudaestuariivita atlantica]|uniref:Peptidase S1 domain-containing protein n=1 Tax=Pseudaestuariivita atlantica TaxID=1317121 RepID=A0A0L1JUA9_9RHOB|nr:trypsin-like peptidase domain-containing protein [Pseudaestuariivita atlantica]KNG95369.1 hypothetical protein ATO11_01735 [Pseudaestuariivita atlantica]
MRALILALLTALPAFAQSPLPALPEADRPAWAAVGRINIAGYKDRSFCTGTLIAPDTVLTAAHCVVVDGAPRDLARMTFVAGWDRGTLLTFRRIRALSLHPGFDITGATRRAGNDLALLTLDKPIAQRQLPGLPPRALGDGAARFAILGYHRKRPNVLNGRFDCRWLARGRDVMTLDCAVIAGNSGGPVLMQTGDGWRVVAVAVARSADENGPGAIAALVDAWVLQGASAGKQPTYTTTRP